ncbi:hypothetical protein BKA93DRAFT_753203 [Sparassis latifolia]
MLRTTLSQSLDRAARFVYTNRILLNWSANGIPRLDTFPNDKNTCKPSPEEFREQWETFVARLIGERDSTRMQCGLWLTTAITIMQLSSVANAPICCMFGALTIIASLFACIFGHEYHARMSKLKDAHQGMLWVQVSSIASLLLDTRSINVAISQTADTWPNTVALLAAPAAWVNWGAIFLIKLALSTAWLLMSGGEPRVLQNPPTGYICLAVVVLVTLCGIAHFACAMRAFRQLEAQMAVDGSV